MRAKTSQSRPPANRFRSLVYIESSESLFLQRFTLVSHTRPTGEAKKSWPKLNSVPNARVNRCNSIVWTITLPLVVQLFGLGLMAARTTRDAAKAVTGDHPKR